MRASFLPFFSCAARAAADIAYSGENTFGGGAPAEEDVAADAAAE